MPLFSINRIWNQSVMCNDSPIDMLVLTSILIIWSMIISPAMMAMAIIPSPEVLFLSFLITSFVHSLMPR